MPIIGGSIVAVSDNLEQANILRSVWGAGRNPSMLSKLPGVNYLGRSTSIILAGGSEA